MRALLQSRYPNVLYHHVCDIAPQSPTKWPILINGTTVLDFSFTTDPGKLCSLVFVLTLYGFGVQ